MIGQRRSAAEVMGLDRLGASHQTRLSFMRVLLRRAAQDGWAVRRSLWEVDAAGVGRAVYEVDTGARVYALVAFAHDLPGESRSDRVIADAWDATFALFDGRPTAADLERLAGAVPLQEAGRVSACELVLSRVNRSVRLWDHVVERLAAGAQPDAGRLAEVGYLMRTTAVYGSGKFGAADWASIAERAELAGPFQAEMLAVWLIRQFQRDLVDHMAAVRGGAGAARLSNAAARGLGIGNSTGLGMAPFLVNHPMLLNNWIAAREEAVARVRAVARATPEARALFAQVLDGAQAGVARWTVADQSYQRRIDGLAGDLARVAAQPLDGPHPWNALMRWAAGALSLEGQESLAGLILEPYGELVDDLAGAMVDRSGGPVLDGAMSVGAVQALLEERYDWAMALDWDAPEADARIWYTSAEKLEPRLADRAAEPVAAYALPLATARDAVAAARALAGSDPRRPVAEVLLARPDLRGAVRRVQMLARAPYGEVRGNTVGAGLVPLDLLRAKLAFFGATRFDPRSDRWLRITLFAGAPYPADLTPEAAEFWVYGL